MPKQSGNPKGKDGEQSDGTGSNETGRPPESRISARLRLRRRYRCVAARLERGRDPADLAEEERAAVHARMAACGVSPLEDDDRAALVDRSPSADRLPGHQLLRGAEVERVGAEKPRRGRSGAFARLRKARRAARGAR